MKKKAQSIIEYTILISIIAAAFIAMHQYVYRAINARLKQVQDELYESPEPGVETPETPSG
ncbi:MAG: hypothetical protein ISS44_01935 [Candidatus Omnitrophica bacterium]|nr:hypothetical protein [Candidatus Omnitrophota bacterium]